MNKTRRGRRTYKSGLEVKTARYLKELGIKVEYESFEIEYTVPESVHKYTPDFLLPNGIIIETKGELDLADRKKHLLIKAQHPNLDIRFVFQNSKQKIYKGSKTTYSAWADKNGFLYSDKVIPEGWLSE